MNRGSRRWVLIAAGVGIVVLLFIWYRKRSATSSASNTELISSEPYAGGSDNAEEHEAENLRAESEHAEIALAEGTLKAEAEERDREREEARAKSESEAREGRETRELERSENESERKQKLTERQQAYEISSQERREAATVTGASSAKTAPATITAHNAKGEKYRTVKKGGATYHEYPNRHGSDKLVEVKAAPAKAPDARHSSSKAGAKAKAKAR